MNVLVLVPARGGSKGVPRKNLRSVNGISLVGLAVRAGRRFLQRTGTAGAVVIDTDSKEIAVEAAKWGAEAPFLRPPELATDRTPTIDSTLHAVARLAEMGREYDTVVLLQPTSPLRDVADIVACFEAYDPAVGSSVSVVHAVHPPEQALMLSEEGAVSWAFPELNPGARRHDFSVSYRRSGAVYVASVESLKQHHAFVVPGVTRGVPLPESRSLDVDTLDDLSLAGALMAARPIATVDIAGRRLGPSNPVFVIAEAGVNHNGDVGLAHRLVDVAANSGADAVKFQTFDPKTLVSPKAGMAAYQVENTGRVVSQAEMLAELVLPREAHRELSDHAAERGILFLSSPFDEASGDFLDELGVPAFKLGSGELTNHPLLAHLAAKGKPLIVSTGMADMIEVDGALAAIQAGGAPPVCLLHCVTSYPASADDANLGALHTMQAAFGLPVGFSDHTEGIHVSLAAVALGACAIEKHFTLDRSMPGPDHRASLMPEELSMLVSQIRALELARGDGEKRPRPAELSLIAPARKSLHAARDLPSGHVLIAADVVALRPGNGIPPSRLAALVGRKMARAVVNGAMLEEADFA